MIAAVDYLGLVGLLAPLVVALFGVAYRMGTLSENVRNMRDDMKNMQADIRDIHAVLPNLPRRKRDTEED